MLLTIFESFISSFSVGALCAFLISKAGRKISLIDLPNERSSHSTLIPRGGGIGIWLSFIVVPSFLFSPHFLFLTPHDSRLTSFIVVAGLSGLLGLVEDRFNLPAKLRLAIQLSLSAIVVYLLSSPLTPYSYFLTFFWIIFITGTANFYNFMDGINGIAGLTGVAGFGLMAFFSYFIVNEYDIALMSIALVSGCLGFLPFNFPKARVFMGDVGSIFLGFVFASFVIKLSSGLNIFLCLVMFLCTFYSDAIVTIYHRWRRGENLMKAHKSHLYQYMTNELKIPHRIISSTYALTQCIFGILAIITYSKGLLWQSVLLGTFVGLFIVAYQIIKRIKPRLSGSSSKVL